MSGFFIALALNFAFSLKFLIPAAILFAMYISGSISAFPALIYFVIWLVINIVQTAFLTWISSIPTSDKNKNYNTIYASERHARIRQKHRVNDLIEDGSFRILIGMLVRTIGLGTDAERYILEKMKEDSGYPISFFLALEKFGELFWTHDGLTINTATTLINTMAARKGFESVNSVVIDRVDLKDDREILSAFCTEGTGYNIYAVFLPSKCTFVGIVPNENADGLVSIYEDIFYYFENYLSTKDIKIEIW